MKSIFIHIRIWLTAIILISCSTKNTEQETVESDTIEITKEQFKTANMEFGTPKIHKFENKVAFVGRIVPKVNSVAKISAPINGVVKKIYVQSGSHVTNGEKLIEVGGNDMIDLQQQFASSSAKLKQLIVEYKRAGLLYKDSIKLEDDFLKIESNYKSELGIYNALKIKLKKLGIDPKDIESGKYQESYFIYAPIEGQVVNLNFDMGQFISSDEYVAEIIDNKQVQIEVSVFEKDLMHIKEDQILKFSVAGDSSEYNGKIQSVSKLINDNTKSAVCYAIIMNLDNGFNINQLVSGYIITNADSLLALPNAAIIRSNENSFVFANLGLKDNDIYQLERYQVNTGRVDDDFTEIKDYNLNKDLLISGTFNLNIE